MTRRTFVSFAVFSTTVLLGGQTKPNFTGTWKINEAQTKQGPPVRNLTFKFEHKDPAFKYVATGEMASGPLNETAEFTTDGKEYPSQGNGKRTSHWEGQILVIEVKIGDFSQTCRLSLSADGKQVIREVVNKFPNRETASHEVYDKQ